MQEPRADHLALTAIIPTRERPTCLERVIVLLLAQTVIPTQIVVVDQSTSGESRRRVERVVADASAESREAVRVCYIHEPTIPGAAVARNRGMDVAEGTVWLFIDDDMEPERDFVEQLLAVYAERPGIAGVSGIITNYSAPSLAFRVWDRTFLRGPFHDERQPIYWNADGLREHEPILVTKFGSGLMSFRASVVRRARFDESLRGLPPGEDVDFCLRLGPRASLVIAPRARIAHQPSATGRSTEYWMKEFAQGKLYVYYRNCGRGLHNRLCCWWFAIGCGLAATVASVYRLSLRPWRALLEGVREAAHLAAPKGSRVVPR